EGTPQIWKVPLRDVIVPRTVVEAPRAGYLVPAGYADIVAPRLDVHGIDYRRLGCGGRQAACGMQPPRELEVQLFRATARRFAAQPVEGHQRLEVEGTWRVESRAIGAGALFVPISQPRARLVMALLEPQAPDSMLQWGLFNNAFERKEYMEAYVAEAVAREMLAADPALKAEFERRVRDDHAFAADPSARLEFFHRRHAS